MTVRIKKRKLHALDVGGEEVIEFENQLLFIVEAERLNRMRETSPRRWRLILLTVLDPENWAIQIIASRLRLLKFVPLPIENEPDESKS